VVTDEIIRRSDERLKDLLNPFDPISGEGSFLPRFAAKITNEGKPIWLPQSMHEEFGRLETEALSDIVAIDSREFQREIERMSAWRTVHDFEFWCYTTAIIMDKESEKKIPFRLNRAQRKVLIKLEAMRLAGDPIRLILLKARQWGGSTMVQIYIAWIQLIHKENWHSTIIAAQETQAVNIRSMYNTLLKNYPLGEHKLEPFEGISKNRIIKNRGCIQSIGSYEKPDSIRSYDVRCSHLSEIGTWQATVSKKPEDLIGSVAGAMLPMANTIAVYESTAQGQGNYFHEKWLKAESGRDDAFQHCFVPWFDNPFDIIHFKTDTDKRRFAENLNDSQIKMLELGATLEGLKWYRFRQSEIESKGGTDVMMLQENPSTPEEAFQSSGYRVFPVNYVSKIRRTCRPPAFIGDIHADEMKGKAAFKNIKFDESQNGHMKVWSMPNDPPVDEGFIFSGDRYVITLDISGGTSDKADFSSIGVIDRYWMAVDEENGKPEVVADWHGRMDADLVAWKAVQIAYWYNKGLFVPESNTFESRYQKTEGDHSFTVLDEIKYEYENIYMRQSPDRLNEQMIDRPGFNSNVSTKPMIVDNFKAFMREDAYVERNLELIHESDLYEVKPNGSYGALDGKHDDILMQRMIGLWIAIKKLPWPKLVKLSEIGNQQKKTSASAAQF
jgi:hypothetical protein